MDWSSPERLSLVQIAEEGGKALASKEPSRRAA